MALLSAKGRNPWLDVPHSMPRHLVKDNQSRGPLDRLHGYLEHMQWGPLVDWLIRQDVRLQTKQKEWDQWLINGVSSAAILDFRTNQRGRGREVFFLPLPIPAPSQKKKN